MNNILLAFSIIGSCIFMLFAFRWLIKNIAIRKCSLTNLDGITRSTHRLMLFGFNVLTWHTAHKSRPSDWERSTLWKSVFGCLALMAILSLPARAQTSTTASPLPVPVNLDVLTNIPTSTNFSSATFGLETGVATENSRVQNYIKADYYLHTNWMVSGEIQNAPVSTVLDSASLYFGYRKVWPNAEIYAQVAGRRTFSADAVKPCWQGGALFGASWYPMTGGKFALTASVAVLSDPAKPLGNTPEAEARAGAKLCF